MRTIAVVTYIFALVITLSAQQADVPQPVEKALVSQYPRAAEVIWDVTEEDEYVATFLIGQLEMSARYNAGGHWLGSMLYLDQGEVPDVVHRTVSRMFSAYEMYDVMKVESPDGDSFYEAILESESEALIVRFSLEGKILLKERIEIDLE